MSKAISILTLMFTLCLGLTRVQAQEKRILYASTDIQQEPTTPRIKTIRGNSLSSFLTVRYEDGTKKRIAINNLWGFIDKGIIHRRTGKNFVAILNQQPGLIEYGSMPIPDYDVTTKSTDWRNGPHYFSKTLDSKLYPSKKAALNGE